DDIGTPYRRLPHHEKGRTSIVMLQKVGDPWRVIGVRTIVERQRGDWFLSDDVRQAAYGAFDRCLDAPAQPVEDLRARHGCCTDCDWCCIKSKARSSEISLNDRSKMAPKCLTNHGLDATNVSS